MAFRAKRKAERAAEAKEAQVAFKLSLKARREEIVAFYRQRDEVRRLRVDRAFRAAGVFASPRLRRLAFGLAATGIVMTDGSLTAACIGAGLLVKILPHAGRARRLATAARTERARDREARSNDLDRVYGGIKQTLVPRPPPLRFSFDHITKPDRILAGLVASTILSSSASCKPSAQVQQAIDALGPDTVAGLSRMIERGSALQVRRLLHWHRGVAPDQRARAVEAALKRHTRPSVPNGPGQATSERRRSAPPRSRRDDDGRGR